MGTRSNCRASTVYWRWRVTGPTGPRYERVVLMAATDTLPATSGEPGPGRVRSLTLGLDNALRVRHPILIRDGIATRRASLLQ